MSPTNDASLPRFLTSESISPRIAWFWTLSTTLGPRPKEAGQRQPSEARNDASSCAQWTCAIEAVASGLSLTLRNTSSRRIRVPRALLRLSQRATGRAKGTNRTRRRGRRFLASSSASSASASARALAAAPAGLASSPASMSLFTSPQGRGSIESNMRESNGTHCLETKSPRLASICCCGGKCGKKKKGEFKKNFVFFSRLQTLSLSLSPLFSLESPPLRTCAALT